MTHWKRARCWKIFKVKGKRGTEDEMVRYHNQLNGRASEETPGDSEGQKSLVGCSPWNHKELDPV